MTRYSSRMKTHLRKPVSFSPRATHSASRARTTEAEVEEPHGTTPNSCGTEKILPQWVWHYRTLLHLRDRLLRTHHEHAKEVATPAEMRGVEVVDNAQEQLDRERLWAELATETDQLFEVDCALQRIHDGLYGLCEETGHPIPPERLRAIPWTRYCRTTAEQREEEKDRGESHRD